MREGSGMKGWEGEGRGGGEKERREGGSDFGEGGQ